jgi:hypothetical protein
VSNIKTVKAQLSSVELVGFSIRGGGGSEAGRLGAAKSGATKQGQTKTGATKAGATKLGLIKPRLAPAR